MRKYLFIFIILIVLILVAIILIRETPPKEEKDSIIKHFSISGPFTKVTSDAPYIDDEWRFSIVPPQNWLMYSNKDAICLPNCGTVGFISPDKKSKLTMGAVNTNLTLEDYIRIGRSLGKDVKPIISEGNITINEISGYEILAEWKNNRNILEKEIFFVKNKKYYIIVFTSFREYYDSNFNLLSEFIKTFKIL